MNDKSQHNPWGIFRKFIAFTPWWHLWDHVASSRIDLKSTLVEKPNVRARKINSCSWIMMMGSRWYKIDETRTIIFENDLVKSTIIFEELASHSHIPTEIRVARAIFADKRHWIRSHAIIFCDNWSLWRIYAARLIGDRILRGTCRTNLFSLSLSLSLPLFIAQAEIRNHKESYGCNWIKLGRCAGPNSARTMAD